MRRIILAAPLIIVIFTTATYSQRKSWSANQTNPAAQQIIQYMTEWANLSNRHDVTGLKKMLPADLVLTFQDGEVQTRDEYLTALKNNPADFTIKDDDQQIAFYENNVAVLRERYEVSVGESKTEFQNTTTFLKRRGVWQPIAFHSSPLVKK